MKPNDMFKFRIFMVGEISFLAFNYIYPRTTTLIQPEWVFDYIVVVSTKADMEKHVMFRVY